MTVKEFYTMDTIYASPFPTNYSQLPSSEFLTQGILFNCSARIEVALGNRHETKGNVTE